MSAGRHPMLGVRSGIAAIRHQHYYGPMMRALIRAGVKDYRVERSKCGQPTVLVFNVRDRSHVLPLPTGRRAWTEGQHVAPATRRACAQQVGV